MVNAVYGFVSMLLKVWKDLKPTHWAVTFDVAGGTFRHEKFKEYKATRVKADQALYDQIPLVHEVVRAFNIPIYEKKGYEADDVIGTIVEKMKGKKDWETYIVTGDMDTLQLVEDGVKVYTLRKGLSDVVVYDAVAVAERFGFGPEMMVDYKALRGDASDNIPGVPGIGEKTATELIQKIGGTAEIYQEIRNPKSEIRNQIRESVLKKLIEGEAKAKLSRELATIDRQVPEIEFKLADAALKNFDRDRVFKLFQELGFVSLLKRIPGAARDEKPARNKVDECHGKTTGFKFSEPTTAVEVDAFLKLIAEKKRFAGRAITESADIFSGKLIGLALAVDSGGCYIRGDLLKRGLKIFLDKTVELIGHNLKQLVKILRINGTEPANKLFDVMIASYLLNPGSRAHDLDSIVLKVLGRELSVGSKQESLFGLDARTAAIELHFVALAADKLKEELVAADNLGLMEKLEMPLILVLSELELNGVAVDLKKLTALSKRVAGEIKKVSKKIYALAGQEFNISSPLQLREILFEVLKIPTEGIKKGKTGLSTSAEELDKMRGLHPIIEEIEIYREVAKLQNTYIDVLPTLINKKTGRIHTSFNQDVTATGRLSSSDPNLQNIPIRTPLGKEIRDAFVAESGSVLVGADYSQIELRIVASLAEDKRMLAIFERDEDIHQATAAAIHGISLDKVTKEMRYAAKEINFGVLYGMGVYGLSWRADIPQWQAKQFIDKYFSEFSGVKKYLEKTLAFTKKEGYSETLLGRRRYLPELNSPNFQLRSAAERMAINHPIQGTAADLIKLAMIEVSKKIKQNDRLARSAKMIIQVHDELVLEVKKDLAEEAGQLLKETMETVVKLRVPVKVEVSIGRSWGDLK